jgi:ribosome-associated protein
MLVHGFPFLDDPNILRPGPNGKTGSVVLSYGECMIRITHAIAIAEQELKEAFLRASGPGGQNVNKLETAVQLRFAAMASPNLPDAVKQRLVALAGRRMTQGGELIITAERHRMREANREEARQKLIALLRKAALPPPPPRKATKPTLGSKVRRLESKTRRGAVKRLRHGAIDD